jgi:amino acid transporter
MVSIPCRTHAVRGRATADVLFDHGGVFARLEKYRMTDNKLPVLSESGEQVADDDALELAKYGYLQQLSRSMGLFSSFAISFSLVSIITGVFANFTFGYRQVGSAVVWSWMVVAIGQLLVALVLADLSSRIPLSGYGYQWSTRLVNPHYGYFVGWLLLMQFLTGFPGVCHALSSVLCNWMLPGPAAATWIPWGAVAIVGVTALVHLFGIRLVSLINDFGVIAELIGTLAITGFLWGLYAWSGSQGATAPATVANAADVPLSGGIAAFALSLLMGAWCLTGFEAAADLAEETHRPKEVVPRVILLAEVGSGLLGLLLIGGLVLSVGTRADGEAENLVVAVLSEKLGSRWMPVAIGFVGISIFACGVASMAATTRLIFSLARDNMIPGSGYLRRVSPRWQTPAGAILLVWLASTAVILGFRRLEIITSISAAAGFLGYAGIVGASFMARGSAAGFSLGRWQTLVRALAFVWSLIVVMALTIPEADTSPEAIRHLPAKSTFVVIAIGLALYVGLIRGRLLRGEAGPPEVGKMAPASPE